MWLLPALERVCSRQDEQKVWPWRRSGQQAHYIDISDEQTAVSQYPEVGYAIVV